MVANIRNNSIKTNVFEICIGGPKSKDFWSTIKLFITNTGSRFSKDIILYENEKIINNQQAPEVFRFRTSNAYFIEICFY
jgi:hypothetical protein